MRGTGIRNGDTSGISRKSKNSALSGSEIPNDDNERDLPNGSKAGYVSGQWLQQQHSAQSNAYIQGSGILDYSQSSIRGAGGIKNSEKNSNSVVIN